MIGIAGAGFSGAVIARELAERGHQVTVFETRDHVAGNCHTLRDPSTRVMVHRYGPHIFHTDNEQVWRYMCRFADMVPYTHRAKAVAGGQVWSLPVNLHTINQVYGTAMGPAEAEAFLARRVIPCDQPRSFRDAALAQVGPDLYYLLFDGYTRKQWGIDPAELPASVFHRLPVRFTYDDNYFNHPWQGIPRDGYTAAVTKILDHKQITVHLGTPFPKGERFDHVVWTGPLDEWFDHDEGRLAYRTLDFHMEIHSGDYQGAPIINYPDAVVPWTRITEHKHFVGWERHDHSVIYREYPRDAEPGDVPFYPVRLVDDLEVLRRYTARAEALEDVTFAGRLGTYRYLDMDRTIAEAFTAAEQVAVKVAA